MIFVLPETIYKGDSFSLEGTLDVDITDWKIRCEIYDDCGQCIKLATANSGGSVDQIEITDGTNGTFVINVAKDQTCNFADKAFIEIQVETNDTPTKEYTIHKSEFSLMKRQITWDAP